MDVIPQRYTIPHANDPDVVRKATDAKSINDCYAIETVDHRLDVVISG